MAIRPKKPFEQLGKICEENGATVPPTECTCEDEEKIVFADIIDPDETDTRYNSGFKKLIRVDTNSYSQLKEEAAKD